MATLRNVLFIGIDPKIDNEFRKMIGLKYGYKRKSLRLAVEEALMDWTDKIRKENDH